MTAALHPAWSDLIEALQILAPYATHPDTPVRCEPGRLVVLADPTLPTIAEMARLSGLGFHSYDDATFTSTRFGGMP